MRKSYKILIAALIAVLLGVGLTALPAQASSNCSIASNCKHTFHITDSNNTHAIDITLSYDVKNASDSGYKDVGCGSVTIKTNPSNSTDAVRVYVETEPNVFSTIGTDAPCVLGGTGSTHNDVAANGTYTYLGSRPYQSFHNTDTPFLKASVWGLAAAGDGQRSVNWALP